MLAEEFSETISKKVTLEEAVNTVKSFRALIKELDYYINSCDDEIVTADKAFGDIRHYIELGGEQDGTSDTALVQLIRDYSVARRNAKDYKYVLEPLKDFLALLPRCNDEIGRVSNEMTRRLHEVEGDRSYRYRVLGDELKAIEETQKSNEWLQNYYIEN